LFFVLWGFVLKEEGAAKESLKKKKTKGGGVGPPQHEGRPCTKSVHNGICEWEETGKKGRVLSGRHAAKKGKKRCPSKDWCTMTPCRKKRDTLNSPRSLKRRTRPGPGAPTPQRITPTKEKKKKTGKKPKQRTPVRLRPWADPSTEKKRGDTTRSRSGGGLSARNAVLPRRSRKRKKKNKVLRGKRMRGKGKIRYAEKRAGERVRKGANSTLPVKSSSPLVKKKLRGKVEREKGTFPKKNGHGGS